MVLVGTIANAFLSFQTRYVTGAFKAIGKMFTHAKDEQDLIVQDSQRVVSWAREVRRDGLLGRRRRGHRWAYQEGRRPGRARK